MQANAVGTVPDAVKWIASTLIAVVGLLVGVWQFNVAEGNRAVYEQRSKLWMNKLETCKLVSNLAGEAVASANDKPKFDAAVREFKKAYWGSMILVEDSAVRNAMLELDQQIVDFRTGNSASPLSSPDQQLRARVEDLAKACRVLVEEPPKLSYPWPFGARS